MAFDGITVRALCKELSGIVSDNGRITKIAQPENDESTGGSKFLHVVKKAYRFCKNP